MNIWSNLIIYACETSKKLIAKTKEERTRGLFFSSIYFITILTMTKNATKKKMGSKSPSIASLLLPLLLIIFTLSSKVGVVESIGRKLLRKCLLQ